MRLRLPRLFPVLVVCWLLTACQGPTEIGQGEVRVSLDSERDSEVAAKVWVEGARGEFLTGATVSLLSPGGDLVLLGFDSSRGAFYGRLETLASGLFKVRVKSRGLSGVWTVTVPHKRLWSSPDLNGVVDTLGNDALVGDTLSRSASVAVQWKAVEGATVFGLVIYKGLEVVYSQQSTTNSLMIPPATLPLGNLVFQVTASYQEGDPYFQTESWVSSSRSVGSSVAIYMEI